LSWTEADPKAIFLKRELTQDKIMNSRNFKAFMAAKAVECLGDDCRLRYGNQDNLSGSVIDVATYKAGSGIKIDVGAIDPVKEYVLRMKLSTNDQVTANLSLRHKGHPWSTLSESYSVRIDPTTNIVERFF